MVASTFRSFAEDWTSGRLHDQWPDHVREKKSSEDDRGRFEKQVYPLVGHVPLDEFSLEHADAVMRAIPLELAPATRRQIAEGIAVYPARILPANPLPRGFLPKPRSAKAMTFLYAREDAKLLASTSVPLEFRILYGFLAREGLRRSEAIALTRGSLDLEVGAVTLDENKTDDPRAWALDAGVVRALVAWRATRRAGRQRARVSRLYGAPRRRLPNARRHAGREAEGALRAPRDAFADPRARPPRDITTSLANGRPEAWVMDRTGHTTSAMLNRFPRSARQVAELGLGSLAPLDVAVPELGSATASGIESAPITAPSEIPSNPSEGSEATQILEIVGRGEGIRTPGTLAGSTDFKSVAFDHSATPPRVSRS